MVQVALALINFCQNASVSVTLDAVASLEYSGVRTDTALERATTERNEYMFTPCEGSDGLHSECIALNGVPLETSQGGVLPSMPGVHRDGSTPMVLPAGAIGWAVVLVPGTSDAGRACAV
jgi:hypothetical protein